MISNQYCFDTFDEAWKFFNRLFLVNPEDTVEYIRGAQGAIQDLMFRVKSPTTTINLGDVGYGRAKWPGLVRTYVDFPSLDKFEEGLRPSKGLSRAYRFKDKEGANGACILAIVLTRIDSKYAFNKAKIIWRTAELQRRWAADLVMMHHLFRDLTERSEGMVKIEEVTVFLAHAYQSWVHVGPLMHHFGVTLDDLDQTHEYTRRVYGCQHNIYQSGRRDWKYSPTIVMCKYWDRLQSNSLPDIPIDSLTLRGKI